MRVEKVEYDVNWKNFTKGYSIFIPCLDCRKAKKEIMPIMKRFKFKVLTKVVIEEGIKGLRIWRL